MSNPTFEVSGRLSDIRTVKNRSDESFHVNKILFPAKDEFSSPTSIFVNSNRPLGQVGTDVSLTVEIYGFERKTENGVFNNHVLQAAQA